MNSRQLFELWYASWCQLCPEDLASEFEVNDDGEYIYSGAHDAWAAWKAGRGE